MRKLSLIFSGLFLVLSLFGQKAPKFPFPFDPKKDADYEKVQPQAVNCMKWYLSTPINNYKETFGYMHTFLMVWTAGIKTIPLVMDPAITAPLLEQKAENKTQYYIVAYLCGEILYELDHRMDNDPVAKQLEGVRAVIKFHQMNKDVLKDSKPVEKYLELESTGKLDSWVGENMTKE